MASDIAVREPTSLVAVHDQCDAIEAWAEQCESVPELRDAANKLAAIDEYLTRTSTEGRGRVAAAMRRLEVRIGKLLGPASPNGKGLDSSPGIQEIIPQRRSDFRQMAANEEVVEEVIAESTDGKPASRSKVMDRLRDAKAKHPMPPTSDRGPKAARQREERVREMADAGYTSRQIAADIGVSRPDQVLTIAKRIGVEIPADKAIGKTRLHDSNRITGEVVTTLEASATALDLVDVEQLDPEQIGHWVTSLTASLRSLNRFVKTIKEIQTHG